MTISHHIYLNPRHMDVVHDFPRQPFVPLTVYKRLPRVQCINRMPRTIHVARKKKEKENDNRTPVERERQSHHLSNITIATIAIVAIQLFPLSSCPPSTITELRKSAVRWACSNLEESLLVLARTRSSSPLSRSPQTMRQFTRKTVGGGRFSREILPSLALELVHKL